MKRIAAFLLALSLASIVWSQGLPRFEFGIAPGMFAYTINCSFDNPNGLTVYLGDHKMVDWDNAPPNTTWTGSRPYPQSQAPFALNTSFLVRFPLGKLFALAYSNRVAFAFDGAVHREDRVGPELGLVMTLAGMTGAEFEYYPMGQDKGLWLGACGGLSVLNQPFVENYITQLGWAAGGTLGWRLNRKIAFEMNGMYLRTSIPSWTVDKVESLDNSLSLSGSSSGWTVSGGLRFGF